MSTRLILGLTLLAVLVPVAAAWAGDGVADLPKLWLNRIGKGAASQYGSAEIDVGEVLYAATTEGEVHKLRLRTGETIWKVKLPERIQMGLAATPEGLFVATSEGVFRLDPADGKTVWGTDLGGPRLRGPGRGRRGRARGDDQRGAGGGPPGRGRQGPVEAPPFRGM